MTDCHQVQKLSAAGQEERNAGLVESKVFMQAYMRKGVLLLLPVASALCITFSLPPSELSILAWFGLSPLLFALRQRGPRGAASLGFLFGSLFCIGSFSWFATIDGAGLPKFLFLIVPIFSLYFLFFGFLYRLISRAIGPWIIVGAPALWLAMEYMRSNLFFLSLPWNLLGHSQYRYLPVIQIADITGVYGISFLIVMVNQFLSQMPDLFAMRRVVVSNDTHGAYSGKTWTLHLVAVALALMLVFSYAWHKLIAPDSDAHIRVALVQGNVLARDNMPLADQAKHLRAYQRLTMEASRRNPALIVWPSTSLPAQISSRLVRFSIRQFARESGAYLLVGGAGHEKFSPRKKGYLPFSNSEFLIAPSGRLEGQYNKIRLLPFNEYLPVQGKITWPQWITTLPESFLPGKEHTLFQVSGVRFGTPICSENMFSALFRRFVKDGAQFMVSVTNEGFFGRSGAPYQSLVLNVFRAVENRVAIVRSSSTGISAFINPYGEIVERVRDSNGNDLFVPGVLVRDVPLSNHKTFYTVYGDIFAYVVIGMAAFIILASLYAQKWPYSRWRT